MQQRREARSHLSAHHTAPCLPKSELVTGVQARLVSSPELCLPALGGEGLVHASVLAGVGAAGLDALRLAPRNALLHRAARRLHLLDLRIM